MGLTEEQKEGRDVAVQHFWSWLRALDSVDPGLAESIREDEVYFQVMESAYVAGFVSGAFFMETGVSIDSVEMH